MKSDEVHAHVEGHTNLAWGVGFAVWNVGFGVQMARKSLSQRFRVDVLQVGVQDVGLTLAPTAGSAWRKASAAVAASKSYSTESTWSRVAEFWVGGVVDFCASSRKVDISTAQAGYMLTMWFKMLVQDVPRGAARPRSSQREDSRTLRA